MGNEIFVEVNESIINDLKNELMMQGHHLTGALEASIKPKTINEGSNIVLTAESAAYLEKLEKGVRAEDIVIDNKTLSEMTRYVQLRMGLGGSKAVAVAYRILQKQKEEGSPTYNSYQYSKTGMRTEVVSETFERNDSKYLRMTDNLVVGQLDKDFFSPKNGTI